MADIDPRDVEVQVEREAHFVIANHSPIVMAVPGAAIFSCDEGSYHGVAYRGLKQVTVACRVLEGPEGHLDYLFLEHI